MINPALFGNDEFNPFNRESVAQGARAEKHARQSARSMDALEDRLERLSLVCMAMWSLLQDKTGVTEEDLLQRVRMLDMMDGEADGKATRTVRQCDRCGRTMSPRHRKCLYCGAAETHTSAWDAV